jgi:hypothetical protein
MLNPNELALAVTLGERLEAAAETCDELYEAAKAAQNGHSEGRSDKLKTLTTQLESVRHDLEALYS